jgi:hypothetical protein
VVVAVADDELHRIREEKTVRKRPRQVEGSTLLILDDANAALVIGMGKCRSGCGERYENQFSAKPKGFRLSSNAHRYGLNHELPKSGQP